MYMYMFICGKNKHLHFTLYIMPKGPTTLLLCVYRSFFLALFRHLSYVSRRGMSTDSMCKQCTWYIHMYTRMFQAVIELPLNFASYCWGKPSLTRMLCSFTHTIHNMVHGCLLNLYAHDHIESISPFIQLW